MKVIQQRILAILIATVMVLASGVFLPTQAAVPGGTVNPNNIPKYVTPLVIPPVMPKSVDAAVARPRITSAVPQADYDVAVRQFKQQILPGGIWNYATGATGLDYPSTTVWSYGSASDPMPDSSGVAGGAIGVAPSANSSFNYPGFTFETTSNNLDTIRWINELVKDPMACYYGQAGDGSQCNYLSHLLPVDQTLHWANPSNSDCIHGAANATDCETLNQLPYMGPVPIVTHVHGAHVNPQSDGYPEAWWLADANNIPGTYKMTGTIFGQYNTANTIAGSAYFGYENDQEATTLWLHDHSMGMTRLNVYAGPASFYLIRGGLESQIDNSNTPAANDGVLPGPAPKPLTVAPTHTTLALNVETPGAVRETIREIPIVIQDRSFDWVDANGNVVPEGDATAVGTKLWYPTGRPDFDGYDGPYLGDPGGSNSDISKIWNPEAFFNTFVVNGVTWPRLKVAAEQYRFRLLNGCNSRTLNIAMEVIDPAGTPGLTAGDEIPFFQIGGDQGYLPKVTMIRTGFMQQLTPGAALPNAAALADPDDMQALLLMPAERADVIVDFTGMNNGTRIRITNTAGDAPFGGLDPADVADPATTGQVMEFVVNTSIPAGTPSTPVRYLSLPADTTINALGPADNTRKLSLNEMVSDTTCIAVDPISGEFHQYLYDVPAVNFDLAACNTAAQALDPAGTYIGDAAGPRQALLGDVIELGGGLMRADPKRWMDPITLQPEWNSTEVWELYNTTMDAHPIHVHLVRFEIVNRQDIGFDANGDFSLDPGTETPPRFNELGFKDTLIAYPGQVTRLKAKFDTAGLYVWHCHIVEHEDNEMMLPFEVVYGQVAAPASITVPATSATGNYTVSWPASATPGVTYVLEESTDNFATYPANTSVVTSGLTATTAAISGKTGGSYSYRVKAVNPPMTDSGWTTGGNSTVVTLPTTITTPNGGEVLTAGQVHQVTWTQGTNTAKYNLWYSTDNKATWQGIASGITGNSYQWTVPFVNSTTCFFQIKAYTAGSVWVGNYTSSAAFTINLPAGVVAPASISVPLTSTTGNYNVSWAASPTPGATYTLEESTDNFATYPANTSVVTSGLTATTAAISGKTGGSYSYRVKTVNPPAADSGWTTGGNSTVVTLPTTITTPNGGEVLTAGQVHQVTWTQGTNTAKYNLWYSTDNKATWQGIVTGVTGNSYQWTVPFVNSTTCFFQIKAYTAGSVWVGNYTSSAAFTIAP